MSRKLEVTFEEKQLWSRLSERLRRSPVGDGLCQAHCFVLVGCSEENVHITAAQFMLSALKHHQSILCLYAACRITFINWDSVSTNAMDLKDQRAMGSSL